MTVALQRQKEVEEGHPRRQGSVWVVAEEVVGVGALLLLQLLLCLVQMGRREMGERAVGGRVVAGEEGCVWIWWDGTEREMSVLEEEVGDGHYDWMVEVVVGRPHEQERAEVETGFLGTGLGWVAGVQSGLVEVVELGHSSLEQEEGDPVCLGEGAADWNLQCKFTECGYMSIGH